MKSPRLISLFAGVGGFELAFTRAGAKLVCSIEINANCRAVIRRHFPKHKIIEDVRSANRDNVPDGDILTMGFPCQNFSAAGLREGFNGEHSVLFFEGLRIVDEKRPCDVVWENVPGLLSSCSCRSCGKRCRVCGELAGADDEQCQVCGSDQLRGKVLPAHRGADLYAIVSAFNVIGYSGAWTLLDSRYFGLSQRRQRLFGVFTRLDSGAERCAEILSLAARLHWNPEKGRPTGKSVAATLTHSARKSSPNGGNCGCLVAGPIAHTLTGKGCDASEDGTGRGTPLTVVAGTVSAKWKKGTVGPAGDECQNLVAFPGRMSGTQCGVQDNIAPSVTQMGRVAVANVTPVNLVQVTSKQNRSNPEPGDPTPTLDTVGKMAVAIQNCTRGKAQNGLGVANPGDPSYTLDCASQHGVANTDSVRRLTPRETERLQGFPDQWTAWGIDENGKRVEMADTTRYEMTGNAVSVPPVEWIAGRLLNDIHRRKT